MSSDNVPAELTLQEAATLLGVSTAHLGRLLDNGVLPYEGVGNKRRIRTEDALALKREDATRRAAARKLTEEAQHLELDY